MSLDVTLISMSGEEIFEANITHNMGQMAAAAGIYQHLWRPEEIGITKAGDLVEPLREGLHKLAVNPQIYEAFNPENGWGSWNKFVPWLSRYLEACRENPDARIQISR